MRLDICNTLAARDPTNVQWRNDLAFTESRLGALEALASRA